ADPAVPAGLGLPGQRPGRPRPAVRALLPVRLLADDGPGLQDRRQVVRRVAGRAVPAGAGVIARVARFRAGRDDLGLDRSEWLIQALREVPGVVAAYHGMADDGSAVSITIFDDPEAAEQAGPLVDAAREKAGMAGPADDIAVYEVVGAMERTS